MHILYPKIKCKDECFKEMIALLLLIATNRWIFFIKTRIVY